MFFFALDFYSIQQKWLREKAKNFFQPFLKVLVP